MQREIESALQSGRVELWFEPQCHVASGDIHALEALLRLRTETGDLVQPDDFIGAAEASGQITPLTEFAIEQAARWCGQWHDAGQPVRVSVNVAQAGLDDHELPARAAAAFVRNGVARGRVTFELTESALAHDHATLLDTMVRLRSKGFQLSLDDFGSGFASLHELRSLPFDELKLDKDIVKTAMGDGRCRGFLESTVVLASSLGLRIVAEGVETCETFDFVADLGCDYAQGHWIAQPMPGTWVLPWLEGRAASA